MGALLGAHHVCSVLGAPSCGLALGGGGGAGGDEELGGERMDF